MGVAAAIYARISQDREGSGLGVERQERDCRKLAERLDWNVKALYVDNDVSAFSGKRRPGYNDLLADIETGRVTGVLAWHPDRLHRSPLELERYIELSEKHSVETHTVQAGSWDLSTPSGRAVARTLGAWARYESEHKGQRIRRARQQQAEAGGWHGGIRPYGFEKDGVTIRPDEVAEIVRAMEGVVSGQSLRSLVRDLNERGIPTSTAKGPWTSLALKEMLMRPRNAGLSSYRGEIVGRAVWPALVPEQTWRAACAILSDPARRTNHRGGTVRWLGSGLYVCGVCERPTLRVAASNANRRTYRCANRELRGGGGHVTREAHSLDAYVERLLVARLSDARVLKKLNETPDAGADVRALELEQFAVQQRLDEQAELHAAGAITARQLVAGTKRLMERSEQITAELALVGQRTPLDPFKGKKPQDISGIWYGPGGSDGDRSGGLTLGARRAALAALAVITVKRCPVRPTRQQDGSYLDVDSIGVEFNE